MMRPAIFSALLLTMAAVAVPAAAQRATLPQLLSPGDVRWINSFCEKRGFAPGSEAHKRCFEAKAKEILDQREADQRYRPNPV